jgi:Zn-dependent protease
LTPSLRLGSIFGIPIVVNVSWFVTLAFITSMLATRIYPELIPPGSPHRSDRQLLWLMAIASAVVFFVSILLHELAHSLIARRQGIEVKNITLFIFGGVSQITGEAKKPLNEFVMAIMGPITSVVLAAIFFAVWWYVGLDNEQPYAVVLEWLFVMNVVLAVFNMAPGFPMDGGRVLRSLIWGVTGNFYRATRLATFAGRALGYALMAIGAMLVFGVLDFTDAWSGLWLGIIGLFLETSARQSGLQARGLEVLSRYKASDVMNPELETADQRDLVRYVISRGGRRYIYFISDQNENVVGVLTEKEAGAPSVASVPSITAGEVMRSANEVAVAQPGDDGASLLQSMEANAVWHLPVISEGRVVGVVSKENLLRLLARGMFPRRPGLVGQR